MAAHDVFVTGATGYLGRALVSELAWRGHRVRGLVRPGSAGRLPEAATAVVGNPLDASTWRDAVKPSDTIVHLVGTPRPNPSKARQFREIDLVSIGETVATARDAQIRHLVYVSVAHPAPIMKEYIAVRAEGEAMIAAARLNATILRPWYVLGPGHRWPVLLIPLYAVLERLPSAAESARRLGLVTHGQMVAALAGAVENPADGIRVLEVPAIRSHPPIIRR